MDEFDEEIGLVDEKEGMMDWPLVGLLIIFLAAFVFYIISPTESLKSYSLILVSILIIIMIGYIYLTILHPPIELRKKLEQTNDLLDKAPLDVLKKKYQEVYAIYLKLTYSQKKNFYGRVIQLRE